MYTHILISLWSWRGAAAAKWTAKQQPWGSIPGKDGVKTELHVLRKGQ